MSKIKNIILFLSGVVVGGFSAYYLTKKKYEAIVEQEVRDLREVYNQNKTSSEESKLENEPVNDEPKTYRERSSLDIQREKAKQNLEKPPLEDYTKYYHPEEESDIDIQEPVSYIPTDKEPYVISPDIFMTEPGYTEAHYTLHPNGSITDDEDGEEIDDSIGMLGIGWDQHIGEFESEAVYVRNEKYMMDIEVVQLLPKEELPSNPIVFTVSPNPANSRKPHEV